MKNFITIILMFWGLFAFAQSPTVKDIKVVDNVRFITNGDSLFRISLANDTLIVNADTLINAGGGFIKTGTNSAVLEATTVFNDTLTNSVLIGDLCLGFNNNSLIFGNTQGGDGWNEQFSNSLTTVKGIGSPVSSPLANFLLPSGYYVAFECMVSGVNSTDSYHQKVTGYARNDSGTITLDYDVVDVKSESATMVITMSTTATGLRIIGTINVAGGGYRATTFMNLNYGKFGL